VQLARDPLPLGGNGISRLIGSFFGYVSQVSCSVPCAYSITFERINQLARPVPGTCPAAP
jgi:hypothetical protein